MLCRHSAREPFVCGAAGADAVFGFVVTSAGCWNYAALVGSTVTLSSARPDAYVVVQPVLPENLSPNGAGQVELSLEVRDTASSLVTIRASYGFGLRRPPVALVHGYNVTNPAWGGAGTITMNDALDNIELRYLNSVWQVFINNGCTLA